jgi:hypothetical protein
MSRIEYKAKFERRCVDVEIRSEIISSPAAISPLFRLRVFRLAPEDDSTHMIICLYRCVSWFVRWPFCIRARRIET